MSKIEELYGMHRGMIMLCTGNEEYTESKIKDLISYVNDYKGFLSAKELNSSLFVITKLVNCQYDFSNFSYQELFTKLEEYYGSTEYVRVKETTNYFLNK